MPAKSKVFDNKTLVETAKKIKAKHALISREADELEALKSSLSEEARVNFFKDLKWECENGQPCASLEGTPEVYGNHEIPVDNNDKVTVNFKLGTKRFGQVDDKPASSQLKGIFGEGAYKKLFKEQISLTVTATQAEIDEQADKNPEFFGVSIKPDAPKEELMRLADRYPDLFNRSVVDVEGYAKAYPDTVEEKTEVITGSSFIEKVGKLDGHILKNASSFLAGLLGAGLSVSIRCGNAAKQGKKK